MKQELLQEIQEFAMYGEHTDRFDYLASGKDGNVFTRDDYAIKIFKADGKSNDDGMKLHLLDNSIYYPSVYAYTDQFMITDLVKGDTFHSLVGHDTELKARYQEEINQAILDAKIAGLSAFDLHNHNIMLTHDGDIRIIDVGRYGIGVDEDTLQCGLFSGLFGSSRRKHKHRRHNRSSSHHRHHRRHSSSHSHRHHRRHSSSSYSSS